MVSGSLCIMVFSRYVLLFLALCSGVVDGAHGSVMLALRQSNTDVLVEGLRDISNPESVNYGKYWTQAKIDEIVAPTAGQVRRLVGYLKDTGVECVQMGAALECAKMPCLDSLSELVDFIEVPATVYLPRHHVGAGDGFVGREVMTKLYNITDAHVDNVGVSLCAVEYQSGEGFAADDLAQQQTLNGETPVSIATEHTVGTNGGPDTETQLDVQMMAQVAENVDLWYWHEDNWLYSFAVHFLNSTKIPDVLSISWGWSEFQQCQSGLGACPNITSSQYVHRVNMEYVKMGLRGVSVMVASGDAGAPGRTNEGCDEASGVSPVFPGSSPYITSVGATYVVPSQSSSLNVWETPLCQQYGCVNGTKELPTNFAVTGWTTGGGFGAFGETRPTWQDAVVKGYLSSGAKMAANFSRNGRGYPDVATVGHNCPVVMGGSLGAVDGTSCSSPVFAGLVALLNDHQVTLGKAKLGFVNPVLYKMWADDPSIFTDITEGNNWCTEMQCCDPSLGFEATKGWDPVSGLGTPNYGRMVEWLDAHT
jgi:subtilase family serine protease